MPRHVQFDDRIAQNLQNMGLSAREVDNIKADYEKLCRDSDKIPEPPRMTPKLEKVLTYLGVPAEEIENIREELSQEYHVRLGLEIEAQFSAHLEAERQKNAERQKRWRENNTEASRQRAREGMKRARAKLKLRTAARKRVRRTQRDATNSE